MRDNRIESLILEAQLPARIAMHMITEDLRIAAKILETKRDEARGAEVAAAGLGLKFGFHHIGRAVDFACYDDNGVYITDGAHPLYKRCGLVWESLGWVWGGRWINPDYDHVQWSNGINSFKEWWNKHGELHPTVTT